jgi:hypothetical protein
VFQNYYVNRMSGTPDTVTRENSIGYTNGGVSILVPRRNDGAIVSITGNRGLSIAYTGWGATFELESFRRINRAGNLAEFRNALSYFDFGSQNFAYADVDGNIAYFVSAEAPVRTDLQTQNAPGGGIPPFVIRDGSGALKHDWMPVQHVQPNQAVPYEVLPENEMPYVINPQSGYVANANNDPIGFSLDNNSLNQLRPGGGIYYLDVGGASAYRMGRIDRKIQGLIDAGGNITSNDMKALQANNQLMDAELVLPHLSAAFRAAAAPGRGHIGLAGRRTRIVEAWVACNNGIFNTHRHPAGLRCRRQSGRLAGSIAGTDRRQCRRIHLCGLAQHVDPQHDRQDPDQCRPRQLPARQSRCAGRLQVHARQLRGAGRQGCIRPHLLRRGGCTECRRGARLCPAQVAC